MALPMGAFSSDKAGNNLIITVVLLLVVGFVADCRGKPFISVGQGEMEEDTSQGSLKEQFPHSLLSPNGFDDVDELAVANEDGGRGWGSDGHLYLHSSPGSFHKHHHYNPQQIIDANTGGVANYAFSPNGLVQKRSLGMIQLPSSSEEDPKRQTSYFPSPQNPQPVLEQSQSSSADIINSAENPGFRIRQKILNLRNQYGDKWFSLVGPYAYRKRQILYRQCFFNPISCF